jgi:hypothetical protein
LEEGKGQEAGAGVSIHQKSLTPLKQELRTFRRELSHVHRGCYLSKIASQYATAAVAERVPHRVYGVFAFFFILASMMWAYQRGLASGRGTPGFAFGMVQGNVVLPLGLAVGIACFWRRNRNLHVIVRILFWASAFLIFIKINQVVNH